MVEKLAAELIVRVIEPAVGKENEVGAASVFVEIL